MQELDNIEERLRKVSYLAGPVHYPAIKQLQDDCAWLVGEVRRLRGLLLDAAMDPDMPKTCPSPAA